MVAYEGIMISHSGVDLLTYTFLLIYPHTLDFINYAHSTDLLINNLIFYRPSPPICNVPKCIGYQSKVSFNLDTWWTKWTN